MSSFPICSYLSYNEDEEELDLALAILNINKTDFKNITYFDLDKLYLNTSNSYRKNLALKVLLKNKKAELAKQNNPKQQNKLNNKSLNNTN